MHVITHHSAGDASTCYEKERRKETLCRLDIYPLNRTLLFLLLLCGDTVITTVQPHTKRIFRMSISAFSPGMAIHQYSHRYTIDEKQKLEMLKLLFVYGIAETIVVYGIHQQ
jgi:hypothetical protein